MKILVIDDDLKFGERIQAMFASHGFASEFASSLAAARQIFRTREFGSILLDLKIPGGGGLSILNEIVRAQPKARVIIHSGFASAEVIAQAFKLGAADYLAKPATGEELLAVVKNSTAKIGGDSGVQLSASAKQQFRYPSLEEKEREYLHQVLVDCDGNISRAAKFLGLHRRSLQRKLAR